MPGPSALHAAASHDLATGSREASPLWVAREFAERDDSLAAARGIANGVALGMLSWLLLAVLVHRIIG